MTIALGSDSSQLAIVVASVLSLVITAMAMQLMAKHRFLSEIDEWELTRIEDELGLPPNARRRWAWSEDDIYLLSNPRTSMPRRLKSYLVWQVGVALFGVAALGVLITTALEPSLLE